MEGIQWEEWFSSRTGMGYLVSVTLVRVYPLSIISLKLNVKG